MALSLPLFLVFLAVFLGLASIWSLTADLWLRDQQRLNDRVDQEFRRHQREQIRKSPLFKNPDALLAELDAHAPRRTLRRRLEDMIEQAGMSLSLRRLFQIMAACAAMLGLGVGLWHLNPLAILVSALIGGGLPLVYVYWRWKRRMDKMLSQLEDTFYTMAKVLRAGQTLSQALQVAATEMPSPLATEFHYCWEQQNLGMAPEIAFRDMAQRVGLVEMQIFVMAVLVQQEAGGNLAELLDRLAGVVHKRFQIRNRIKALTTEGRLQALILMALPPVLFVGLLLVQPSYASVLLDHPQLLLGTIACQLVGALWIFRIMNRRY